MGPYFQTKKSLRQGDPLSPMLAIIIARAKEDGQIRGVVPHLIEDGLSILQYTDDNVFFLDHHIAQAMNMELLLCTFEQLSGLKIILCKSEVFCFGQAKICKTQHSKLFGCKFGTYPLDT